MSSNAARGEPDEGVERSDVFLYRSEVGNEGESCNVLCLFLFFISLFFVMLMTADNSAVPAGSGYEGGVGGGLGVDVDGNLLPGEGGDRSAPDDLFDSVLIQCLNFKGRYRVEGRGGAVKAVSGISGVSGVSAVSGISGVSGVSAVSGGSTASTAIPAIPASSSGKGNPGGGAFEAKLITLKLSLYNVTKSFLFLYFEPQGGVSGGGGGGEEVHIGEEGRNRFAGQGAGPPPRTPEQPSKFQFVGVPGLNVNRESAYMFNGAGYNFLTLCQDERNCICKYNVGIQQNVAMQESTSLREVEESYLFLLKRYLMDEAQSLGAFPSASYREQYERYLSGRVAGAEAAAGAGAAAAGGTGTPGDGANPPHGEVTPPWGEASTQRGEASTQRGEASTQRGEATPPRGEAAPPQYDGYISSDNCGLFVRLEGSDVDKKHAAAQVTAFSVLYNIKSLIELGLFYVQIGRSSENMRSASKVSLLSICLNSFIDLFESLLLLYEVMLSRLLLVHFIFMVLLKFVLFTLMELRYILIIWRANHQQDLQEGWDQLQRKLGTLYKFYYGSILLVIVTFYYVFPVCPYVLLLLYMCWVPQILLDIWKGQRHSINLKIAFALSLCRVFLPVYRFMYPKSIFQLDIFARALDSSNSTFSILLIVILAVQLLLMSLQRLYGPRHLIDLELLPHVHNYYRTVDPNFETGLPECVICMYDIVLKNRTYCVTPCLHIFHEKCLQQWMDVKLECPTCRGALPNFP
ncbi:hypothetical protein PVBG_04406 [Plasmodium vivax Brazil I]|uniref:RING-type E3 ubiquitin transferase n=1 Tax=Plasmodium vivax (strain Brazil I) TaxID=1033975 RepID=A0A0J9VIU3_PLAV1|nr:hypothetical protein PVBG_04406 [Plasmodium vivax Brazil I]